MVAVTQTHFFNQIFTGLSQDRLNSYRHDARSSQELVAYYAWNTALCESLYPSLNSFEVTLRNSLHTALSNRNGGRPEWYTNSAKIVNEADAGMIREAFDNLDRLKKPRTAPYVVSELKFGFWVSFFDRRYASSLWPHIGRQLFPKAPVQELQRDRLSRRVDRIRRLRNRVFHFEPLWHWPDLDQLHNYVLESTGYINPSMREMTELFDRFPEVYKQGVTPYQDTVGNYVKQLSVAEASVAPTG